MHLPARTFVACIRQVLWAACCVMLCGVAGAQEDPPGRVGRIVALQGEVWIYDNERSEWVEALRNRPLTQGDRLSTAAQGHVELSIGSTALWLGGGTELEAVRLDDEAMQFQLQRGKLALRVRSREVAGELLILTDEGRFSFQSSGLYRVDRRDDTSEATVSRGDMSFRTDDFLMPLLPGQRAEFWQEGSPRSTRSRWLTPLNDDFAQAVMQQDQAAELSVSARYVSPEMTGVEDLDRHGRWQDHPEYGAIWTPTVVVQGWAPYRHGHWAWLRPWGWTWVDDAAWGFAPFHYGRWVWWGGRWGWTPGPRVLRPVFAPALVGWAGGKPPPYLAAGGRRRPPSEGWVPLAPREAYRPGYAASPGYLNRINVGRPGPHGPAPVYGNRHVPGPVNVPGGVERVERESVSPRGSIPVASVPQPGRTQPPATVPPQPGRDVMGRPAWQGGGSATPTLPTSRIVPPAASVARPARSESRPPPGATAVPVPVTQQPQRPFQPGAVAPATAPVPIAPQAVAKPLPLPMTPPVERRPFVPPPAGPVKGDVSDAGRPGRSPADVNSTAPQTRSPQPRYSRER